MRIALYVRVSTQRQAQTQTIEQQLDRLRKVAAEHQWPLAEDRVFRDDGYSGASLRRPGLDKLRDLAALAQLDRILFTEPDRLARNYVHQVLLLEELQRHGCRVEFVDRSRTIRRTNSCCKSAGPWRSTHAPSSPSGLDAVGCTSCNPARCCRGRDRPTATGRTRNDRVTQLAFARTRPRRRWWQTCSAGTPTRTGRSWRWSNGSTT